KNRAYSAESFSSVRTGRTRMAAYVDVVCPNSNAVQRRAGLFGKSQPLVVDPDDISVRINQCDSIVRGGGIGGHFRSHHWTSDCDGHTEVSLSDVAQVSMNTACRAMR